MSEAERGILALFMVTEWFYARLTSTRSRIEAAKVLFMLKYYEICEK